MAVGLGKDRIAVKRTFKNIFENVFQDRFIHPIIQSEQVGFQKVEYATKFVAQMPQCVKNEPEK